MITENGEIVIELERAYRLAVESPRASAYVLTAFIYRVQQDGDFQRVNKILLMADPAGLSNHGLAEMARATYATRSQLPEWQRAYDRCKATATQRGANLATLFAGLPGY